MEISIAKDDILYNEIINSTLSLKELITLGLKTRKILMNKDSEEKNS